MATGKLACSRGAKLSDPLDGLARQIHGIIARIAGLGSTNAAALRFRTLSLTAAAGLLVASGIPLATPASALDLDEVTVVTVARDGSWGVATAGSTGEAIAVAVRACRAMASAPTDCGARLTTTRGRWVIANLCGDHPIIVGADTREEAEAGATEREIEIRRAHVPDLPPCRRVLTVGPAGVVAATAQHYSTRAKTERPRP